MPLPAVCASLCILRQSQQHHRCSCVCVCLQSFPSSRSTQWHRAPPVWDQHVPGTGWELILLAETLRSSCLQMRGQSHIPVLAHPATPTALPVAASAASAAALSPWHGRVKGSSSSPPELSPHVLQAHTWLAAGTGVEGPSGPVHSRGWSARAASHQCCLSEEQGLSSLWGRSSGHPEAWRASAGPRVLQHCSLNIPSGAQLGVTLGPSLGRVWR